ncbi:ATP synthase subunit I [Beijerinckia mobilis]|uniref:ATP synthase subunit I n=1 Tax=Beijerinckia mobilis TaxID=231434 RepID=UPI00054E8505|nr:ATP synthase subunit I [Beijerinckia mobilis]
MKPWFSGDPSPGALSLMLGAHFVGGFLLGVIYFRAMWWNTRLLAQGTRPLLAISIALCRYGLLGGLLVLASREGVLPLLVTVAGLFVGRFVILRRVMAKIS